MLINLIPALNEQPKVKVKTQCTPQPEEFHTHLGGSSAGSVGGVLPLPAHSCTPSPGLCTALFPGSSSQAAKCLSPAEAAVQVPKPCTALITLCTGLGLGCISQPSFVAPAALLCPPSATSLLRHFPSETSSFGTIARISLNRCSFTCVPLFPPTK